MRVGLRQFSAETVGWLLARALTAARVALRASRGRGASAEVLAVLVSEPASRQNCLVFEAVLSWRGPCRQRCATGRHGPSARRWSNWRGWPASYPPSASRYQLMPSAETLGKSPSPWSAGKRLAC